MADVAETVKPVESISIKPEDLATAVRQSFSAGQTEAVKLQNLSSKNNFIMPALIGVVVAYVILKGKLL